MCLFQAPLDICLGSLLLACLSVHRLHVTVYAGSIHPHLHQLHQEGPGVSEVKKHPREWGALSFAKIFLMTSSVGAGCLFYIEVTLLEEDRVPAVPMATIPKVLCTLNLLCLPGVGHSQSLLTAFLSRLWTSILTFKLYWGCLYCWNLGYLSHRSNHPIPLFTYRPLL